MTFFTSVILTLLLETTYLMLYSVYSRNSSPFNYDDKKNDKFNLTLRSSVTGSVKLLIIFHDQIRDKKSMQTKFIYILQLLITTQLLLTFQQLYLWVMWNEKNGFLICQSGIYRSWRKALLRYFAINIIFNQSY